MPRDRVHNFSLLFLGVCEKLGGYWAHKLYDLIRTATAQISQCLDWRRVIQEDCDDDVFLKGKFDDE